MESWNRSIAIGMCSKGSEIIGCFNESSVGRVDDEVMFWSHDVGCVVCTSFGIQFVCGYCNPCFAEGSDEAFPVFIGNVGCLK